MIALTLAAALAAPLAPGDAVEAAWTSIDGQPVHVPDPEGRPVVLELIRSPDW